MPERFIKRFQRIDFLIYTKRTGSPKSFAKKLEISESMLYEYLNVLKELNVPFKYDKERETYYYTENGRIEFKFKKDDDSNMVGVE